LLDLVRRPVWMVGLLVAAASLGFHLLALGVGALAVVQPLLVCGLLFALPISAWLDARRPSASEWLWALVLVAGLAIFLDAARPADGSARPNVDTLAALVLAGVALASGSVALGLSKGRRYGPSLVGLAAGVAYGLVAPLLKWSIATAVVDPDRLAGSWPGYALVVIGSAALVLNQIAYQAGPLAASLPAMTIAEPVVAVIVGATAFGEQVRSSPTALVAELAGLVGLSVAVVKLTRRMHLSLVLA
jgi:hypothetical protein